MVGTEDIGRTEGPEPDPHAATDGSPTDDREGPPRPPPPGRWAWTLVFAVLLPAGALLIVGGAGPYADPVMRIIGGSLLAAAVVISLWLLAGGEQPAEGEDEETW